MVSNTMAGAQNSWPRMCAGKLKVSRNEPALQWTKGSWSVPLQLSTPVAPCHSGHSQSWSDLIWFPVFPKLKSHVVDSGVLLQSEEKSSFLKTFRVGEGRENDFRSLNPPKQAARLKPGIPGHGSSTTSLSSHGSPAWSSKGLSRFWSALLPARPSAPASQAACPLPPGTSNFCNTWSLTHWVRRGIEPASSWILVRFITAEPQWERPPFCHANKELLSRETGERD